jgi:hypothetical protein
VVRHRTVTGSLPPIVRTIVRDQAEVYENQVTPRVSISTRNTTMASSREESMEAGSRQIAMGG